MKYALSSILVCFSLFCLPSCNDNETPANTPDGEEVEEVIKSYDWQLEGKWEYASNNGNDFSRRLVFEKDGKGSYDDGTLEWYCSNNHLYIDFDNGKSIKDCDYLFYGATLQLKNPQLSYILDCPLSVPGLQPMHTTILPAPPSIILLPLMTMPSVSPSRLPAFGKVKNTPGSGLKTVSNCYLIWLPKTSSVRWMQKN